MKFPKSIIITAVIGASVLIIGCNQQPDKMKTEQGDKAVETEMRKANISRDFFGSTDDGKEAQLYTLTNENGAVARISNYGGIIVSLTMPDKNGRMEDVVLGFDSLADYQKDSPYFGALIGRYGNRIAKGKFKIGKKTYTLPVNNGPNSLHGGDKGFDKVIWDASIVEVENGLGLKMKYRSEDGEQGYPGNLDVMVLYTFGNDNSLRIDYTASTDAQTIVNLTQHSYFNLSGNTSTDILDHILTINADKFIPVDKSLIPTGEIQEVENTPFDFSRATAIGQRINNKDVQLERGNGYDHCWVLNDTSETLHFAARLHHPANGRTMEIFTDEPGLQFYSGNFLDGSLTGKFGTVYNKHFGLALETQHFPDSPNQTNFPNVMLKPGEVYKTSTIYKFSVEK